jgi:hypothetical protein
MPSNKSRLGVGLKTFILIGLFLTSVCICVFAQGALSQGRQESDFYLFPQKSAIWQSREIPVCWENPSGNSSASYVAKYP